MRESGGNDQTTITGLSRRDFLRAGGAGLASGALARPATASPARNRTGEDRSVILLLLVGGPSQLETFDPKPDAPAEIRGPFASIATRIPAIRVSEHLPRLAARMDRVALVRSVHHDAAPIHETGLQLLQTGRLCQQGVEYPHFGSVASRVRPPQARPIIPMLLPGPIASTGVDIPRGQSAGCLGSIFDPITFRPDIRSDRAVRWHRSTGDSYGQNVFGHSCNLARRLVEVFGSAAITINMFDTVFDKVSWDCHGASPFSTFDDYARQVLPTFDRAFNALLDDLERSGRLDSTLVVAAGEFGRTPRINASGGRDHWPRVWSVALAGGGIRGGQVVGASDSHAAEPADRPVSLPDLLATIYHSLGIDHESYVNTADGQRLPLLERGQPLRELFS